MMSENTKPPYSVYSDWSDEELINAYNDPHRLGKWNLYDELACRANENDQVRSLLFEVISSHEAQEEVAMGFIKHSWLPSISILKFGNAESVEILLCRLQEWPSEELSLFKNYMKTDESISVKLASL